MYRHLKSYLDVVHGQGVSLAGCLFKALKRGTTNNEYSSDFDDKPIGVNTLASIPKKVKCAQFALCLAVLICSQGGEF